MGGGGLLRRRLEAARPCGCGCGCGARGAGAGGGAGARAAGRAFAREGTISSGSSDGAQFGHSGAAGVGWYFFPQFSQMAMEGS